ncbi:ATP-dependent endonuclease, partial [Nanoarchaeota archaeon]
MTKIRLKHLHCTNIKSFRNLDIDIEYQVIVGKNDSGKTSILRILDLAFNHLQLKENEFLVEEKTWKEYDPRFPIGHKARRIFLTFDVTDYQKDKEFKSKKYVSNNEVTLVICFYSSGEGFFCFDYPKRSIPEKEKKDAVLFYKNLNKYVEFLFVPSYRNIDSDAFKELETTLIEDNVKNALPVKTRSHKYINYLEDRFEILNKAISSTIEKQSPIPIKHEIGLNLGIDFEDLREFIMKKTSIKDLREHKEDFELDLKLIGTGITECIYYSMLQTYAIRGAKDKQIILGVDEPENFLHPHAQREVFFNMIKKLPTAITTILTTHSPTILDSEEFGNIRRVHKDKTGITHYNTPRVTKKNDEIYSVFLNPRTSELLYADLVLLVEGESDELVIRLLLKKYLPNLYPSISIVKLGGNTIFVPWMELINTFSDNSIPWLAVTDLDSLRNTESSNRPALTPLTKQKLNQTDKEDLKKYADLTTTNEAAISTQFENINLISNKYRFFIMPRDLEYSLVTQSNYQKGILFLNQKYKKSYPQSLNIDEFRKHLGSYGLDNAKLQNPSAKLPYIHVNLFN